VIKPYSISYIQRGENMNKLSSLFMLWLTFFHYLLLQWTLMVIHFLYFSNFLSSFLHNILSHFSYILLFYFIVTAIIFCQTNSDCEEDLCLAPIKHWCNMIVPIMIGETMLGSCECIWVNVPIRFCYKFP